MLNKLGELIHKHIKNHALLYFLLSLSFMIGITVGAFAVNSLSNAQRIELTNYIKGFFQLLWNQNLSGSDVFNQSLVSNIKLIAIIWLLGVTVIGIPMIFLVIGIRGFITGFSVGFIIYTLGWKGIVFTLVSVFLKDLLVLPFLLAIAVNGINFSMSIINSRTKRKSAKESEKFNFGTYCLQGALFSGVIMIGVAIESYLTPAAITLLLPMFTG